MKSKNDSSWVGRFLTCAIILLANVLAASTSTADSSSGKSCQITQAICPNYPYPNVQGTFEDTWGNANLGALTSAAACTARAQQFYDWCGINPSSGQTTTATFFSNGTALQSVTIGTLTTPVSPNCQSNTLCVHASMPLLSQHDGGFGGKDYNKAPVQLIPYINSVVGSNISTSSSDPGWCTPTSAAMIMITLNNEAALAAGRSVASVDSANSSATIYNMMQRLGTNILGGGTPEGNVGNLASEFYSVGGQMNRRGLIAPSEFNNQFNNPLIIVHISEVGQRQPSHTVAINGTDAQYYVIFDPWGTVTAVTYEGTNFKNVTPVNNQSNYSKWGSINYWGGASVHKSYMGFAYPQLTAQQVALTSPLVFDANYYLANNSDLSAAFGTDTFAAARHWVNTGIYEGRQGTISFNSSEYLNMYNDLREAFGSSNSLAATLHFINHGSKEGRSGRYALRGEVFNAQFYLSSYPDLQAAFGSDLILARNHWLNYGIYEGRQASNGFSAPTYLSRYPDLLAAFGTENYKAVSHYITNGLSEGRKGN